MSSLNKEEISELLLENELEASESTCVEALSDDSRNNPPDPPVGTNPDNTIAFDVEAVSDDSRNNPPDPPLGTNPDNTMAFLVEVPDEATSWTNNPGNMMDFAVDTPYYTEEVIGLSNDIIVLDFEYPLESERIDPTLTTPNDIDDPTNDIDDPTNDIDDPTNDIDDPTFDVEEESVNNIEMDTSSQDLGNEEPSVNDIDALPRPNKARKRSVNPQNWKVNIRKLKHNAGEEYVNQKGKVVQKKEVKTKKDCLNSCKFKCGKTILDDERQALFDGYYNLKSHDEKSLYLLNCTEKVTAVRKQKKAENDPPSRRQYSFRYFFNVKNQRVQVCKTFFLSTLSISQKPIYNVHQNKNHNTNLPKRDQRGRKPTLKIPEHAKNDVRKHISSFPVVESHYSRRDTTKHYLDSSLSISKMYGMFKEKYPDTVIKESRYRQIFVTEYNLDFHVPKSDRCDICEEHKMSVRENLPITAKKYEDHINDKNAMRAERNKDRESENSSVLCFDLENVITCPRAEIGCFFYMRKLNVYNLTAHLKTKDEKKVYCAIWTELTGGRSGNDIASAVFKIVKRVLNDFPNIENLITWSDSCVPQNRNQMMTGAMMHILQENPTLQSIQMKYSTPGHGAVQEVDNVHSHIEKAFKAKEFYSPLGLIRILMNINKRNPFIVIQMMNQDFLDFGSSSKELLFNLIPFTNVASLTLSQVFGEVKYSESHGGDIKVVNVKPTMGTRGSISPKGLKTNDSLSNQQKKKQRKKTTKATNNSSVTAPINAYKAPKKVAGHSQLQAEKKRDLKRMLKFMPLVDREYYAAIFKE